MRTVTQSASRSTFQAPLQLKRARRGGSKESSGIWGTNFFLKKGLIGMLTTMIAMIALLRFQATMDLPLGNRFDLHARWKQIPSTRAMFQRPYTAMHSEPDAPEQTTFATRRAKGGTPEATHVQCSLTAGFGRIEYNCGQDAKHVPKRNAPGGSATNRRHRWSSRHARHPGQEQPRNFGMSPIKRPALGDRAISCPLSYEAAFLGQQYTIARGGSGAKCHVQPPGLARSICWQA